MSYTALWIRFFLFTTAVELVVAVPLLRGSDASRARRVGAIVIANFASHPVVWFVLARMITSRALLTVVAESWAVGCEAYIYALVFRELGTVRAIGISFVANAASYGIGTVLVHLGVLGAS